MVDNKSKKLEEKIDDLLDKYATLMCEIRKRWPDELGYAEWIYTSTYVEIYSQTNDQLEAYQLAYRALENFYEALKGRRTNHRNYF